VPSLSISVAMGPGAMLFTVIPWERPNYARYQCMNLVWGAKGGRTSFAQEKVKLSNAALLAP
jgi:hypothetical protein